MTLNEYRVQLRAMVDRRYCGVQAEAAREWKVSPQFLSEVLRGTRGPGDHLTRITGFRLVTTVEPVRRP